MPAPILAWRSISPWRLECRLDLTRLFATDRERASFEEKYPRFLASDPSHPHLFRLEGENLIYLSEQLVPEKKDDRPPLLLILGNPASHSVDAGMFFSFEADGREHRFWKNILRPAGLDLAMETGDVAERNQRRRERLLELDYRSPYRIGLAVFVSMPSAASGPWSGVAGVRKLLGGRALDRLVEAERQRVVETARAFMPQRRTAAVFQKDAWEGLRRPEDPAYDIDQARAGSLIGALNGIPSIKLRGLPPTRLAGPCREVLARVIRRV